MFAPAAKPRRAGGGCSADRRRRGHGGQIVTPGSRHSLLTLLPGFSIAFWLVIYYHTQSKDPIVERYGALLLCLMATALALYHQAGWSFGKANPVRGMTFTLIAGIYAFTAMPAAAGTADLLALTAIGLWMLLHAAVLPVRRRKRRKNRKKNKENAPRLRSENRGRGIAANGELRKIRAYG